MDGLAAYKENAVVTQSKGRLIVLMYDGAIKFLRQAIEAIQRGDNAEKGQFINKAVAVIEELDASLDTETGGDIAGNLRKLYLFMTRHLNQANVRRDQQMLREVITLLEELNEGWKAITA